MSDLYDVAIIGGGPAGLSATLNAASEGLSTVMLCAVEGGQAGTSSLIENYLGFPSGISGPNLTDRAKKQALKFGADIKACSVEALSRNAEGNFVIATHGNEVIRARAVVVATGAAYNRLPKSANVEPFEDRVHYACNARTMRGRECGTALVVGGGNSAGQAAMFLADRCGAVTLVARRALKETMSAYLLERLEAHPNVTICTDCEVRRLNGGPDGTLETAMIQNNVTGEAWLETVSDVFVMIGARPNATFLQDVCELDRHGFVKTDGEKRTSTPGLFAVGDVRSGSVKRVSNAVGEGATCVPHVWAYLNPLDGEEA